MVDTYPPGDFRHVNNQWADTDGDGMSRRPLVQSRQRLQPDTPRSIRNSRLRWLSPPGRSICRRAW